MHLSLSLAEHCRRPVCTTPLQNAKKFPHFLSTLFPFRLSPPSSSRDPIHGRLPPPDLALRPPLLLDPAPGASLLRAVAFPGSFACTPCIEAACPFAFFGGCLRSLVLDPFAFAPWSLSGGKGIGAYRSLVACLEISCCCCCRIRNPPCHCNLLLPLQVRFFVYFFARICKRGFFAVVRGRPDACNGSLIWGN